MPEAGNTVPDGPQISKPQSGLRRLARRILPYAGTALALIWILHRISLRRLAVVLATADYGPFLLLMGANAAIYFLWDTAVLTLATRWFHGPVRYRDVLPVRAASSIPNSFLASCCWLRQVWRPSGSPCSSASAAAGGRSTLEQNSRRAFPAAGANSGTRFSASGPCSGFFCCW